MCFVTAIAGFLSSVQSYTQQTFPKCEKKLQSHHIQRRLLLRLHVVAVMYGCSGAVLTRYTAVACGVMAGSFAEGPGQEGWVTPLLPSLKTCLLASLYTATSPKNIRNEAMELMMYPARTQRKADLMLPRARHSGVSTLVKDQLMVS